MLVLSNLLLRLGLYLHMRAFRRELNGGLDNGTVELWGAEFGIDEDGCVCSEQACFFRKYHEIDDEG